MTSLPSATRRAGPLHAAGIGATLAVGASVLSSAGPFAAAAGSALQPALLLGWAALAALLLVWVHAADAFVVGFAAPLRKPVESGLLAGAAAALLLEGAVLGGGLLHALVVHWWPLLPGAARIAEPALVARVLAGLLAVLVVGAAVRGWVGAASASIAAAVLAVAGVATALAIAPASAPATRAATTAQGWLQGAPLLALLPLLALAPAFKPPKRRTLGVAAVALIGVVALLWLAGPLLQGTRVAAGRSASLVLLVALTPACLLAVLHRLVAGYEVAAGIERSALLPAWLVGRSKRLGTPLLVLGLQLAGVLLGVFLLDVEQAFVAAVALAGLATTLFALHAAGLGWHGRRWWTLPVALLVVAGAAGLSVAATLAAPVLAGSLLALALGLGVLALGLRAAQSRVPHLRAASVEKLAASSPHGIPILTLHEAIDVVDNYKPRVLVATRRGSRDLLERAALRAEDDRAVFVLYVDELPGMFYPPHVAPSATAVELLLKVCSALDSRGYQGIPIWRVAHDPAASIAQAARDLRVERVLVDVGSTRPLSAVLSGRTLSRLRKLLGKVSLEVVRPEAGSTPPAPTAAR
jgi:hypothetical protein